MNTKTLHPNTRTLLSAWQRMTEQPGHPERGPNSANHPDLIDCLFVIERSEEGIWGFRNAGDQMARLLGRELADHDFLDFWTGHDRILLEAFLEMTHDSHLPAIVMARGETLTGQRIDVEITLAPLPHLASALGRVRLIGLYQTLGGSGMLSGRPVWRHRVTAIYPPDVPIEPVGLHLVASND